jgi:DNA-3-methyladenine glycosylase
VSGIVPVLSGAVTDAARALLGRSIVSEVGGARTAAVLTEVEAYGGGDDPASHAVRGPSPRNRSMFGPPGTLYVYRSYGLHWCVNVVTGPEGEASAVLLRGGVPLSGLPVMEARRGRTDHLCDGPGRLAQALGVTGDLDGTSVFDGPIHLDGEPAAGEIIATARIGVTKAVERPWRFVLTPVA